MPASLVRFNISALIATTRVLPDIDNVVEAIRIWIHDVISPQSLAPEFRCDSIERAEHKTGDGEQRESRQVSEGTTGDRQWTGRRKCSKQPERREHKVENGA